MTEYNLIDLSVTSEFWEGQIIEILITDRHSIKKKLILANFYRPPNSTHEHIYNFVNNLNEIFDSLKNYKFVVVIGDFNINLLKFKENVAINDFLDSIMASGYLPKITVPTRLTQRRGTLIDNIFVKLSNNNSSTTA